MPKQTINKGFLKSAKFNLKNRKLLGVILITIILVIGVGAFLYHRHSTNKTSLASTDGTAQSGANKSGSTNKSSSGNSTPSTSQATSPSSSSATKPTPSSGSGSSGSQSGGSDSSTPTPPTITATTLGVDNTSGSATCGQSFTYNFTGTITANGPGTITYHCFQTDVGDSGSINLTFNAAGTKTVTKAWTLYGTTDGQPPMNPTPYTLRLETLTPNVISKLQQITFTSTCI